MIINTIKQILNLRRSVALGRIIIQDSTKNQRLNPNNIQSKSILRTIRRYGRQWSTHTHQPIIFRPAYGYSTTSPLSAQQQVICDKLLNGIDTCLMSGQADECLMRVHELHQLMQAAISQNSSLLYYGNIMFGVWQKLMHSQSKSIQRLMTEQQQHTMRLCHIFTQTDNPYLIKAHDFSLEYASKYLPADQNHLTLLYKKALTLQRLKQTEQALEVLQKYDHTQKQRLINPQKEELVSVHNLKSVCLDQMGNSLQALTELQKALQEMGKIEELKLETKRKRPHYHRSAGMLSMKVKLPQKCTQHLLKAHHFARQLYEESDINCYGLLFELGQVHRIQNDFGKAYEYFEKCLKAMGGEGQLANNTYLELAVAAHHTGRHQAQLTHARQFLSRQLSAPSQQPSRINLGIKLYSSAINSQPQNAMMEQLKSAKSKELLQRINQHAASLQLQESLHSQIKQLLAYDEGGSNMDEMLHFTQQMALINKGQAQWDEKVVETAVKIGANLVRTNHQNEQTAVILWAAYQGHIKNNYAQAKKVEVLKNIIKLLGSTTQRLSVDLVKEQLDQIQKQ